MPAAARRTGRIPSVLAATGDRNRLHPFKPFSNHDKFLGFAYHTMAASRPRLTATGWCNGCAASLPLNLHRLRKPRWRFSWAAASRNRRKANCATASTSWWLNRMRRWWLLVVATCPLASSIPKSTMRAHPMCPRSSGNTSRNPAGQGVTETEASASFLHRNRARSSPSDTMFALLQERKARPLDMQENQQRRALRGDIVKKVERAKGFEPSTFTLAT